MTFINSTKLIPHKNPPPEVQKLSRNLKSIQSDFIHMHSRIHLSRYIHLSCRITCNARGSARGIPTFGVSHKHCWLAAAISHDGKQKEKKRRQQINETSSSGFISTLLFLGTAF